MDMKVQRSFPKITDNGLDDLRQRCLLYTSDAADE